MPHAFANVWLKQTMTQLINDPAAIALTLTRERMLADAEEMAPLTAGICGHHSERRKISSNTWA